MTDKMLAIGQKIVVGIDGTALSEPFIQLVKEYKVANVILFKENIADASQTRRLCADIQRLILAETGAPAFIAMDEEGGTVSRVPDEAIHVPGNMAVAATGDPANAALCARIAARQLKGLGVNFNLAPDLDVNSNPANPVIGIRSWGDDPVRVGDFAEAAIRGYAEEQVLCCGKHFPGHGDTAVDSHLGLPCVARSRELLEQVELQPFKRAVKAGIPAIMSSHILFPALEPERVPATMSRRIMTGLMREQLGFDGLILSDCMAMDAIRKYYGTAKGALAAVLAGVDLVFVCHHADLQLETARLLRDAALTGVLPADELEASAARILRCKAQYAFSAPADGTLGRAEDRQSVHWIAREAVTHVGGPLFTADERTFFCGTQAYRGSLVGNVEERPGSSAELLAARFGAPAATTSGNPDETEIRRVLAAARSCPNVVILTANGHLMRGQLALANALAAGGRKVMAVALRNPYDLAFLPDTTGKLAAFGGSSDALDAVADVLRGGACAGRLPVRL